jgi:hypothetical protein
METKIKSLKKQMENQMKDFEETLTKEKAAMQKKIKEMEESQEQELAEK